MKQIMPLVFVGHGSPMNAIEDNHYTRGWKEIAREIPKPEAILMISAHWFTQGSRISDRKDPKTVYDMYGFPEELYRVQYPVPGSPELARTLMQNAGNELIIDNTWGIDHGAWSVLVHMYPKADIPVLQLSIDRQSPAMVHYEIGKSLSPLREQGILIIASGNIVHNLREVDFRLQSGYKWAEEFDLKVRDMIHASNHEALIDYRSISPQSRQAIPTPDHYLPLLYLLGASDPQDTIATYNRDCVYGSLSMTSYLFHR